MFKDKEEVQLFNHINSHDSKTPIERALKLAEECGEVAEAMLSAQEVSGSSYKDKDYSDVIKECIDVVIVAKSIIASVISGIDPQITMEVVNETYDIKMEKWQEKCSVPPMEVDEPIIEPKKEIVKVFSYKKFVEDSAVLPSTIEYRDCLKKMDGIIVEKKSREYNWYTIKGTGEDVHKDWTVDKEDLTPYGKTIECNPKNREKDLKVFCYKKYEEDPISNSYETKKILDGMIIHLEDGNTDILNVYHSGRDGVITLHGKDMYVHEDWIVPKSEFELRIPATTLVVDIQKWLADMRHIDEDYYKLDGVEVCRHDIGNWYEVEYEGEEYNVHRDWLTPYGEFIKRKWGK